MAAPTSVPEIVIFNARFCGGKKKVVERFPSGLSVNNEKSQLEPDETSISTTPEPKSKDFNIKRARYEIIRYGMTGFDKERHMNSKIAMAIRLGAKPPKKQFINYKTLMEQKLKEKETKKNERQYNLQPLKQRKKTSKKKRIKNQPNSLV